LRHQSCAVVGLEATLWANRDDLVAIHELPGFGALHESLMGDEFLGCLRRPVLFNVARTRNVLAVDRSDALGDQI
jgi:hypothetical protein